jgi:hypothetical protein
MTMAVTTSEDYPDCTHSRTEVRLRIVAGGQRRYSAQCLECGWDTGSVPARVALEGGASPPPFDKGLAERARERRLQFYAERKTEKKKAFWAWYDDYLVSAEWREKRARVLKRDGGVRQGCLSRPATQVHHRTYAHVGAELLFELISLCDGCHERAHDGRTDGADMLAAADRAETALAWLS